MLADFIWTRWMTSSRIFYDPSRLTSIDVVIGELSCIVGRRENVGVCCKPYFVKRQGDA